MRKVINSTYTSLGGVIEDPQNWPSSDVVAEHDRRQLDFGISAGSLAIHTKSIWLHTRSVFRSGVSRT